MENKRKHVRVNATIEVLFRKAQSKLISSSRSKDISEIGICIPLTTYYAVDSILDIEIRSDDFKAPLKTFARVAWIANRNDRKYPFEAGLELLELSADKKKIISDYINGSSKSSSGGKEIRWVD